METPILKITDFGLSMSELESNAPPSIPSSATTSPTAQSQAQARALSLAAESRKMLAASFEHSFGYLEGDAKDLSMGTASGGGSLTPALGPGPYTACRGCSLAYASPEVEGVLGRMRDMGVGALETDGVRTYVLTYIYRESVCVCV